MQSRYVMLGEQKYSSRPENYEIEVFRAGSPDRAFTRIARLDVHFEKTHFTGSSFEDALPELKEQARLSGADAIIDIQERTSSVGETKIYHVTAIGVRYPEPVTK